METVTLEGIEAQQQKLAAMIEQFKAQPAMRNIEIPAADITLAPGEHYAGIILNEDGTPSHHLVLLPNTPTDALNWQAAKDWAKRIGGEIPTRREQSLLYANLKGQFEERWYWSSEQHAADAYYAWCQDFGLGYQDYDHKINELRARAVRRLTI